MKRGRGGALRLLKSLRGDGTLMWGQRATRAVTYSIDLYGQGQYLSGDGEVLGDLADLVGRAPANPRLRLATGQEATLIFRGIAADSASIELTRPVPVDFEAES
jgi:hypothetical protein